MKKSIALILAAASLIGLVACGSPAGSNNDPVNSTPSQEPSVEPTREYVSPYEHEYVYYAPGKIFDAETSTEGEANKLVAEAFNTSKHKGPNYMVYVRLMKEANGEKVVKAGRRILFQNGDLLNVKTFETTGTWAKEGDVYTINLEGFETRNATNEAVTLTTTADGKVEWNYSYNAKEYPTTLYTSASFIGEYTGTFTNMEGEVSQLQEFNVDFKDDNTLYTYGAFNDTGIAAFEGTIDEFGCVQDGKFTRLDGTFIGFFYTDLDGKAKFHCTGEARERTSTAEATIL